MPMPCINDCDDYLVLCIIALTGEKVIPDIASWQSMVDQAHSQTEQFLIHIESMSPILQKMEGECKVSLSV